MYLSKVDAKKIQHFKFFLPFLEVIFPIFVCFSAILSLGTGGGHICPPSVQCPSMNYAQNTGGANMPPPPGTLVNQNSPAQIGLRSFCTEMIEMLESRGMVTYLCRGAPRMAKITLRMDEGEVYIALGDKAMLAGILEDVTCIAK